MKVYGYIRVSGADQNEDRQIIAMDKAGIQKENIFMDKQSGKNINRPNLQSLLAIVKQGDTIIVESVSRFARNTRDLLELVEKLTLTGVDFVSQKEHIDTTTPTGKFMLTVFGAVAELERGYILQRQREGISAAKAKGKHLGRPVKQAPDGFDALVLDWEHKLIPLSKILEQFDVSKSTFYRRLREYRNVRGDSGYGKAVKR